VTKIESRASVRKRKFAALDTFVKAELAQTKAVNIDKTARLKALRLARDAEEAKPAAPPTVNVSPDDGKGSPGNSTHRRRFSQ
jgi:hypothetical protein